MKPTRVLIMGAAGRDFHNFNLFFRNNPEYKVVGFTAAQIPNIAGRRYPRMLAGKLYPRGVPIFKEEALSHLIKKLRVDEVILAYSDLSHEAVMQKASTVLAAGADFKLMGPHTTMLKSKKPVVSVCAVRTGCGKSQTTREVCQILKRLGKKVVVVRHPMAYGDLEQQACQRFATPKDLNQYECTVEEREEYEPHIRMGTVVYAGIDYAKILKRAEAEGDVIVWDGGNNDFPFFKPSLHIVVADPHRAGHELTYYPGETNVKMADIVVINKVDTAKPAWVKKVEENVRRVNPSAKILRAKSKILVEKQTRLKGKKVLVIEDGPTLTHGGMAYGAAFIAAKRDGATPVDPRPWASGSIDKAFRTYPHLGKVLPALGYGKEQLRELAKTINKVECDLVLVGTPVRLEGLVKITKPLLYVSYQLEGVTKALEKELKKLI